MMTCVCVYIYIYIHTNLPVNAIVRLPNPRSGDSQGQKTFLAPSADKQIRNHDTRVLKYYIQISIYIYIQLMQNTVVGNRQQQSLRLQSKHQPTQIKK